MLFLCLVLAFALAGPASADTGPKPSVRVSFENAPEGVFYGTLLSERSSTGPARYDPDYEPEEWQEVQDLAVWRAFQGYEDADGYYFLNELWDCSAGDLAWTYYPPENFKLLLYFPETGEFRVSGIYSRYAFDSYFTAGLASEDGPLELKVSYDLAGEAFGLLARVVITIALELAAAFAWGYRSGRELGFITAVNVITQLAMNIAANLICFFSGTRFAVVFIVLELAVTFAELLIYVRVLPKRGSRDGRSAAGYAIAANLVSAVAGMFLAELIPGAF